MTEPVEHRRPPGRPRLDPSDDSMNVNIRMPVREFDRLDAKARQLRITVPELIRRHLRRVTNEPG